jgi:transposase-like protein
MHTEFKNLIQLFDYFDTESKCIEYLEKQRWNGEPTCPHCGHGRPYCTIRKRVNSRNKTVETKGYKCSNKECRKKFSVLVGTIFENSKIPLRTWFGAIYIATAHKKGVSSLQLSRDLNITQKSAWFVLHRIREMLTDKNPDLLEGMVEIDETYVGGKDKNKHAQHRTSNKWEGDKKTPVVGIVERGGRLRHTVVKDTKNESIKPCGVCQCKTRFYYGNGRTAGV